MTVSTSAREEFPQGRILWTTTGVPIDAKKPAAIGECCVLGCGNRSAYPSAFCSERHRRETTTPALP